MTAIVVLGMHRSGTSCLAAMIEAAGLAFATDTVRNWDNARGHHELLDLVRLDEAVLAHSGGSYVSPPAHVRWTADHAAARDRLLASNALLKDPRTLLVLPFWRASSIRFREIAIVRHPLAVARSLYYWRGMPIEDGVALWLAHNRALDTTTAAIDFDAPDFVAQVARALGVDEATIAAAHAPELHHHDAAADAAADDDAAPGLEEAIALFHRLGGRSSPTSRFPRAALARFESLLRAGDHTRALASAREALASITDAAAVLVPAITSLVRHRAFADALQLLDSHLDTALADLLRGKVLLAMGDAPRAVAHLEAACAVAQPFYQARHLLPQALRAAGRHADARTAMHAVAAIALYPHNPLATLAEWSYLDGDLPTALAEMQRAIDAAPPHRRGRLRTRRAEWLLPADAAAARRELERAIEEDPAYTRARDVLAAMESS